ncbi:hypothetical protein [Hymenobacter guriensis]|uniref:Uncharacterized protein n=1 Tax=Hymenobacter guriensis TaxID=2793065 RepID=A0ABS0KZ27_9BACT|nr:hypothetical protein [Hymenobacter guriensis]MBG8553118.1 hypothetical protein [Hymenobacter guriensis]
MTATNVPKAPAHDDPTHKKQEDQHPNTNQDTNKGKTITPDKAHDPQR